MENLNFTSTIYTNKSPEIAFRAIKNFRAWWSEEIEGQTDKIGESFFYHYKDIHLCKLKLIEETSNHKLVYLITENEFSFIQNKSEWVNTKLIFELTSDTNGTLITFTHEGLTPLYECYPVCKEGWTNYIQNSLSKLIATGKGEPNPKNKEGFNAQLASKWKID